MDITLSGPEGPSSVDHRIGSGAGYGAGGSVRGELVDDDLSAPGTSDGKVRLVGPRASRRVQALALGGPRPATDLACGTVTDCSTVAATTWDVRLGAGGTTQAARLPVVGRERAPAAPPHRPTSRPARSAGGPRSARPDGTR